MGISWHSDAFSLVTRVAAIQQLEPRSAVAQVSDPAGDFAALHAWIADHLAADLRVERLAERIATSPRALARLYAARTGHTSARTVEAMCLDAACRLLEQLGTMVARIADRCGLSDDGAVE